MKVPPERQALKQVLGQLSEFHGVEAEEQPSEREEIDAFVRVGASRFAVQWKGTSSLAAVDRAARQVKEFAAEQAEGVVPLVAVPFMGPVGRERCQEAGVSWLDLSGNARIETPGLRVRIEGRPNRFKRRGRPSSAFAAKSSRIARWLLMNPKTFVTQREIARATEMDEGYTSKIVARLEEVELIERDEQGAIRARNPDLLLDAWRADYDFTVHEVVAGHIPARSGAELLDRLAEKLGEEHEGYAATGLGAAWLMTHFAGFRLATVYLAASVGMSALDDLGFREEKRGANLWVVIPTDEGVFQGAEKLEGVRCVHPVQVYLDLQQHPERAAEAAEQLRSERLRWTVDD